MRRLPTNRSTEIQRIRESLPPRSCIDPAWTHALRDGIEIEEAVVTAGKQSTRMHDVDPEGVQYHWRALESIQIPFIANDEAAQIVAIAGSVDGERLDCAKNAAEQDERRRSVEHDTCIPDVGREHAVSDATAVDQSHEADENDLHSALQDERYAEKRAASLYLRRIVDGCRREHRSTSSCEALHCGSNVYEDDHDAAGMEWSVHWNVPHQAAKYVVFGG